MEFKKCMPFFVILKIFENAFAPRPLGSGARGRCAFAPVGRSPHITGEYAARASARRSPNLHCGVPFGQNCTAMQVRIFTDVVRNKK